MKLRYVPTAIAALAASVLVIVMLNGRTEPSHDAPEPDRTPSGLARDSESSMDDVQRGTGRDTTAGDPPAAHATVGNDSPGKQATAGTGAQTAHDASCRKTTRYDGLVAKIGLDLQVDAEGNPIREPPPEYRGSALHWRLKFPLSEHQLAGLLRNISALSLMERTSVFQKVRRTRNPFLGLVILEEIPKLPKSPGALFSAASALTETARGARRLEERLELPAGAPSVREQTSAAVSLLARKATEYGEAMAASEWGGVRKKLKLLFEIDPGILDDPYVVEPLKQIRVALELALGKAIGRGEGGYLGGCECFGLARLLGGEEIYALLLDLLRQWAEVEGRIGYEPDACTALLHTMQALLDPPCEVHGREAAILIAAQCRIKGPRARLTTMVHRFSRESGGLTDELREILRED